MEYEIKPKNTFSPGFKEIWQHRELLFYFTWRDIKVKYKDATLGIAWAILQPLFLMSIFALLFQKGLKLSHNALPYPVFAYSGLTLWFYFSNSVSQAASSMESNSNIIRKIYFPRIVIPFSAIAVAAFDFIFAFLVLLVVVLWIGNGIYWLRLLLFLPLSLIITTISAAGLGSMLAALNVLYKDFRYIIPFFIQVLFFTSPIFYDISMIDDAKWTIFLEWNPIYAALELFRGAFVDHPLNWQIVIKGCVSASIVSLAGIYVFRKMENYFADLF